MAVLVVLAGLGGCKSSATASEASASDPSSAEASSSSTQPTGAAPSPSATPAAVSSSSPTYVFPVRSKAASFGRFHHDYPATDIFAPCGTSVVAATAGVVFEVIRADHWSSSKDDGAARGGLAISIVGTDGVRYYGSHLRSVVSSIIPGRRVRAGELLGKVGNTGDARGTACHLHFGLSPPCAKGDWWTRRGVVSPYPFLKAWQSGRSVSPVKAVSTWRAKHGCPKKARADP